MTRKSIWGCFTVMLTAMAVVTMMLTAGCGSGSSTSGSGTLKVSLSDKASDDFQKLVISIKEVRVVPAGYENSPDNDAALPVLATYASPLQVDVLSLRFLLQSLGQVTLPAGSYTQLRLILANNVTGAEPANYLTLKTDPNAGKIPVKTPSATTSGLKVNCQLNVQAGNQMEIVVDFDPNSAIVATGNGKYIFKPTGIRVVEVKNLPPAFGYLTGVLSAYMEWYNAEVTVVPSSGGAPVATSNVFASYSSGSWVSPFSAYVPGGSYRVHVNAPGFMPYSSPIATITAGSETSLGTVSFVPPLPVRSR